MPVDITSKKGEKSYTKEIKGREKLLDLQGKALQLNEAKQNASTVKEEKISAAKRLALSKKADKTELGKLINKGLFAVTFPACKNKKLTLKDVEEINFGGAIVGVLVYYVPGFSFEHPIVILISRGVALFLKVRTICEGLLNVLKKERKEETTPDAGGKPQGYGRDEQKVEHDYVEAGRTIDGLIGDVMEGKK